MSEKQPTVKELMAEIAELKARQSQTESALGTAVQTEERRGSGQFTESEISEFLDGPSSPTRFFSLAPNQGFAAISDTEKIDPATQAPERVPGVYVDFAPYGGPGSELLTNDAMGNPTPMFVWGEADAMECTNVKTADGDRPWAIHDATVVVERIRKSVDFAQGRIFDHDTAKSLIRNAYAARKLVEQSESIRRGEVAGVAPGMEQLGPVEDGSSAEDGGK